MFVALCCNELCELCIVSNRAHLWELLEFYTQMETLIIQVDFFLFNVCNYSEVFDFNEHQVAWVDLILFSKFIFISHCTKETIK